MSCGLNGMSVKALYSVILLARTIGELINYGFIKKYMLIYLDDNLSYLVLTNDVNKALDTKFLLTAKKFIRLKRFKAITQQTLVKKFILNYYPDGVVIMASYLESQNDAMDEIDMRALL